MCNYNYENFIGAAIESVLTQDYGNWECIVVDDGSSDHSREVIKSFATAHPERIRILFKENEGQGQGFDDGVAMSKGEIVCFLDSDDIWLPGKLGMVNRWFSERDDIALLQHSLCIMEGETKTDKRFRALMGSGDLLEESRRTRQLPQFISTSGLAFSRKILDKVLPIPKAFLTCADGYLTRTSMCHGMVYSEPRSFGYYRQHGSNCVLDNGSHDASRYVNLLLVPQLNAYYRNNHIALEFPTPRFRLDTKQHMTRIKTLNPWERWRCSHGFEVLRGRMAEYGVLIDPVDHRLKRMRGMFKGKTCHVLGRTIDSAMIDWDNIGNDFVFIADVNALLPQVRSLKYGMYCISDLRFWEERWGVSPRMKDFLAAIKHLYKLFELPARPRYRSFPGYGNGTFFFKTVDRDFGIWKGNITLDATRRLSWGFHVVLDMCLPLAFHMGFEQVKLHGCNWNLLHEEEKLRDFFALFAYNNDYNLSENVLPFTTAHGRTDFLWRHSLDLLTQAYEERGMAIKYSQTSNCEKTL